MKNRLIQQEKEIKKSVDSPHIPALGGDEEVVKERTPNKLLTRPPISWAQMEVRSNSYKLNELNHTN